MEESKNSEIYDALVRIKNGEDIPSYQVEQMDTLVYNVRFNQNSPGKSRIKLRFNSDEDYWKLFDLTQDDIWFANAIYSDYDTFDFEGDYIYEDWHEGYVLRDFNEENTQKLKDILILIAPEISKLEYDDDYKKASELLRSMYERRCDEIIYSYQSERNACKVRGAKQMIEGDTCEAFQNYGILNQGSCFDTYLTTVSVLLSLYKMAGDTSLTITELLKKIGHTINISGDWYEFMYETDCVDFDNESINRNVSWELDKIMDELIEDENFVDMKATSEKIFKILKKYKVGKAYPIPRDPKNKFKILKINPKEQLIVVEVQKGQIWEEKRNYNIDDFDLFLYHPELF